VRALAAQHPEWRRHKPPFEAALADDRDTPATRSAERGLAQSIVATHSDVTAEALDKRSRIGSAVSTPVHPVRILADARAAPLPARQPFQNLYISGGTSEPLRPCLEAVYHRVPPEQAIGSSIQSEFAVRKMGFRC
jgi:hypothetical protein